MMKNILFCSVIIFAIVLISCDDKNDQLGPDFVKMHSVVPIKDVEVNEPVWFGELSKGVTFREWTFPDSDVVDILGSSNDLTSHATRFSATFSEEGRYRYRVTLHLEFADTLTAEKLNPWLNGTSVVDTAFTISVSNP